MKPKRKIKRKIFWAVVTFIVLYYFVGVMSTNKLVHYVEDVFRGNVPASETNDTPYSMYNVSKYKEFSSMDLDIHRAFVIHNFKDGYMFVYYRCIAYDSDDKMTYASIVRLPEKPSIWRIHRENGEWNIVDIDEHP